MWNTMMQKSEFSVFTNRMYVCKYDMYVHPFIYIKGVSEYKYNNTQPLAIFQPVSQYDQSKLI